ncbi:hypothetical protein ACFL09_05760, partial [Planctomycetota bacterium]
MKKLITNLLIILALTIPCFAVTFGSGQTWEAADWPTQTNIQPTRISTWDANDGFLMLDVSTPYRTITLTDLTGWSDEDQAGTDSSSDGNVLIQSATTAGNLANLNYPGFGENTANFSAMMLVQYTAPSVSTATDTGV